MSEYWKSNAKHWCEYCKCWLGAHAAVVAYHNNGAKHKEAVEQAHKDRRAARQAKEAEEDKARRAVAGIEAAARDAYARDVGARPEDAGVAPPGGAAARARRADAAERAELEAHADALLKRDAEEAYRAAQGRTAAAQPRWAFDASSGYYRDAASGAYYDGRCGMYYHGGAWSHTPPAAAAPQEDAAPEYPLNPYSRAAGLGDEGPAPAPGPRAADAPAAAPAAPPAPKPPAPTTTAKPATSTTTGYELGLGTLHPAYEAARSKSAAAKARAAQHGEAVAVTGSARGLGAVRSAAQPPSKAALASANAKRKRDGSDTAASKAEAEALARREAAKARVQARQLKGFGLT